MANRNNLPNCPLCGTPAIEDVLGATARCSNQNCELSREYMLHATWKFIVRNCQPNNLLLIQKQYTDSLAEMQKRVDEAELVIDKIIPLIDRWGMPNLNDKYAWEQYAVEYRNLVLAHVEYQQKRNNK